MSEERSTSRRLLDSLVSPVGLIRLSSVLTVLLAVGHMSAYPWNSAGNAQEVQLVGLMKSVDFTFMGERSTYWNLYFGWGLLVAVLLITMALVLWLLADLAPLAPRRLGTIIGVLSVNSLMGAVLAFHYFYVPPCLFYSVIFVLLLAASARLLGAKSRSSTRAGSR
jgi:hypothetical protein